MQVRTVSSELQKKAEDELHEVPSRIPEDLKHVRDWLAQQPHLNARTDDQWLLNFLRGCSFNLERTKEKMDLFYTTRTFLPAFFTNRDPFLPEIQDILNRGIILPLRKTSGEAGPRIVFVRYEAIDPDTSFQAIVKTALMIVDILMNEDDNSVIGGQQGFLDMKAISITYLIGLDGAELKSLEICLEKAYPTRPKKFDFINTPAFFASTYNMFKQFISPRLTSMINIYSETNPDEVYETVPRSLLPTEYGGEGGSIESLTAYWKTRVESRKDWLMEDAQYCCNESKRPGKPKTAADVFPVARPSFNNSMRDLF